LCIVALLDQFRFLPTEVIANASQQNDLAA
jgi:hypothetical protein